MGISIIIWPQQHHSPFLFPFNFDSFTPLSSKKRLWQYKHGTVPPCKIKLLFPLTGHSKFTPDDALISTRTDMFSYSWVIDLLKCCCGHLIRSPPWLKILFVNIRTLARLLLVPTNYCQNGMPECIHQLQYVTEMPWQNNIHSFVHRRDSSTCPNMEYDVEHLGFFSKSFCQLMSWWKRHLTADHCKSFFFCLPGHSWIIAFFH